MVILLESAVGINTKCGALYKLRRLIQSAKSMLQWEDCFKVHVKGVRPAWIFMINYTSHTTHLEQAYAVSPRYKPSHTFAVPIFFTKSH